MASNSSKDFGELMIILLNDTRLKELMLIPQSEINNFGLLIQKYFIETHDSDILTTEKICRLLVRTAPQNPTRNHRVYEDSVLIEIYVPANKDRTEGFQRRVKQICDRLIRLLHQKRVNGNLFKLSGHNELSSGTNDFRRYFVKFDYFKVY